MRCRASMETFVALSMQIDPYGHQELHLDRCPCSGDVELEFLQARRYFVQLLLNQFRQSSTCMRRGERGTAGTQGIHERLDSRCRCPGWCVVYLGPGTLKRKAFVEQAPSDFRALMRVPGRSRRFPPAAKTCGCAQIAQGDVSPLAICFRGRPRRRRVCGCERGASNASRERKVISVRRPT